MGDTSSQVLGTDGTLWKWREEAMGSSLTALGQAGTNAHVIMWGCGDTKAVEMTAKSPEAQDLCYWPGGGGKLQADSKVAIVMKSFRSGSTVTLAALFVKV